jgi:hypothetical protein
MLGRFLGTESQINGWVTDALEFWKSEVMADRGYPESMTGVGMSLFTRAQLKRIAILLSMMGAGPLCSIPNEAAPPFATLERWEARTLTS